MPCFTFAKSYPNSIFSASKKTRGVWPRVFYPSAIYRYNPLCLFLDIECFLQKWVEHAVYVVNFVGHIADSVMGNDYAGR